MNFNNLSGYLFAAWLMIAVLLFIPPTNPPGAAPVRVADVAPSHYAVPTPHGYVGMPLSTYLREPALTYEERFSPEAIGPRCPVAVAAVNEQGVGE